MSIREDSKLIKAVLEDLVPNYKEKGDYFVEKSLDDIKWFLVFIDEAVSLDSPRILENYLRWCVKTFEYHGLGKDTVKYVADSISKLAEGYPRHQEILDSMDESVYLLDDMVSTDLSKEADHFAELLYESKRKEAVDYVHGLLDKGMSVEELYKDVFQNTLYFVGRQWQEKKYSVAHEHYSTVVVQFIMSTLYDKIFSSKKKHKKLLAFSVSHELHEIGIRMISDLFEINGWDTEYLGSSLPVEEFINYALEFKPDLIAISVTMPYHLNELKDTIATIRTIDGLANTKIVVGGRPFMNNDSLYKTVGADGYAKDLKDVIEVGESLVG